MSVTWTFHVVFPAASFSSTTKPPSSTVVLVLDLSGFAIRLRVSDAAASRVRVFDRTPAVPQAVIGPGIPIASWPAERVGRDLRFEGLDYPDAGFTGLITCYCELMRDDEVYGTDKLVLRVAPWLALPPTQRARTLYIAEMADGSNQASIDGIKEFARAADVKLVIVPPAVNRADRWLQQPRLVGGGGDGRSLRSVPTFTWIPSCVGGEAFLPTASSLARHCV